MVSALKPINLALAFLLELAMLAAFVYWGFHAGTSTATKLALGIGVPALVAVIWGILMAPKSAMRLRGVAYLALKLVLFGLAVAALIAAGNQVAAAVLGLLFVINTILLYVWSQ